MINNTISDSYQENPRALDRIDQGFIKHLEENNGICVAGFVKAFDHIPESTVRYRIKSLIQAGHIKAKRTRRQIVCYSR